MRTFRFVVLLVAVVFTGALGTIALRRELGKTGTRTEGQSALIETGLPVSEARIQPMANKVRETSIPPLRAEAGYGADWHGELPPASAAFRGWTNRFLSASVAERIHLEAEGVNLARGRRSEMLRTIVQDPERAIRAAVKPITASPRQSSARVRGFT